MWITVVDLIEEVTSVKFKEITKIKRWIRFLVWSESLIVGSVISLIIREIDWV